MRRLSVFFMAILLTAGTAGAQQAEPQPYGDLAEVMRGILFPNSNLIFDAQTNNPDDPVEAAEGDSTSARFASIYTGWEALENAAVALVEAANLIELPRVCENLEDDPRATACRSRSNATTGSSMSPGCGRRVGPPTSGRKPASTTISTSSS